MITIKIPKLLTDETLSDLLQNRVFDISSNQLQQITFDFSDTMFVKPIGLLAVLAMMKYCKNKNVANRYCILEINPSVSSYLERMDFYRQFNIPKNTMSRHYQENKLLEIHEINGAKQGHIITEKILKIIEEQVPIDKSLHSAIAWAIGEAIDNIEHHSKSEINGFVCAQTYSDSLEIAIVDCGVGILQALRSNDKFKHIISHSEAINVATGKYITSRPDNNSGIGLFITKRILKLNKGTLLIMSGNSLVRFLDNSIEPLVSGIDYWQGTLVGFKFNLQVPVDVTKDIYYSEFPQDAHEDLDDMF